MYRIQKVAPAWWGAIVLTVGVALATILILRYNFIRTSTDLLDILLNVLLLNGFSAGDANNLVVRGGWFMGALVIYYLLFPLLFKFYKTMKKSFISGLTVVVFPLIFLVISDALVIFLGKYFSAFDCQNNTYGYYNFINQLPCFAFGFSAFDFYKQENKSTAAKVTSLAGFILCFALTVMTFYSTFKYSFVFVPDLFGGACLFLLILLIDFDCGKECGVVGNLVCKFGKYNYGIYLTHIFIVYDANRIILKILGKLFKVGEDIHPILFFCLLPINLAVCYFVGKRYMTAISAIEKKTSCILERKTS